MKASVLKRVQKLVRKEIQALKSYHVPDSKGMIKLDAMENPFQWPGDLGNKWTEALAGVSVNRYPDPHAAELTAKIRAFMSVPEEFDIMLGNGSDELIQTIALALAGEGRSIMAPEPGFVMYSMIATFCGMDYVGLPLGNNFELDTAAFKEAMEQHEPAVVFLAQPNNPTGNLFGEEKVRRIIEGCPGLVVLDEAYLPFSDSNLMPLLQDYDNVVIMRTFSKMGLAGLRLGVLVGRHEWLVEFDKLRLPYNINVLTQESAKFALDNVDVLNKQTALLRASRSELYTALAKIPFVHPYQSEANFILVRLDRAPARTVFAQLKEKGILIKCLDGAHPLLANCLRITVGTAQENAAFLSAFETILKSHHSSE
jgi:histidinol-phosphate aminotransferase